MAQPIPEEVRERLTKLCGMLGSAHEGERNAALVQVNKLMFEHRLTWAEVLAPPSLPTVRVRVGNREPEEAPAPAPNPPPYQSPVITWQVIAATLLNRHQHVFKGDRELGFVASILQRGRPTLSEAQEDWLRDIAWRAGLTWQ